MPTKIKFFTGGLIAPRTVHLKQPHGRLYKKDVSSTKTIAEKENVFINLSFIQIKHFYQTNGKCKDVEWLMPEYLKLRSISEQIDTIHTEQPDIVCFGVYTWNYQHQCLLAERIKKEYPHILIVMGGPELNAHKEQDFFKRHSYVDYVVYGDGERAFQQLLDFKLGLITDTNNFVNIVENDNLETKVYPYERFTDKQFWSESPILGQAEFFLETLEHTKRQLDNADYRDWYFLVGVEFSRGCMYKCTFCDWSQGLTHKVSRRKYNWKEEIDFFHKHNLAISETDANFGQWDEDLEIYDYAASLYDPARNFSFVVANSAKLKKSATEYLIRENIKVYNMPGVLSLQDIHDPILRNIDRPSISWEEHVSMIRNLRNELTPEQFSKIKAQLILGLPGQTIDSFKKTILEITKTGLISIAAGQWVLLSSSPAADTFYQKLHKLTFEPIYSPTSTLAVDSLEDLYRDCAGDKSKYGVTILGKYLTKTKDLSYKDLMTFKIFVRLFTDLPPNLKVDRPEEYLVKLIDRIYALAVKQVDEIMNHHIPLMEKYGIKIPVSYANGVVSRIWY